MNAHDHSRNAFLLLAVGAFVTLLVGGVAGYGVKHSAFPWEARHMDTTKNELSLDVHVQESKKSSDIDKKDWPNLSFPLVSSYEAKILQPDQEFTLRSDR